MNPSRDESDDPRDDEDLSEFLSSFKQLGLPDETRIANRVAVATELRLLEIERRTKNRSWWRRSISVPIPVAASFILFAAALSLFVVSKERHSPPGLIAARTQPIDTPEPKRNRQSDRESLGARDARPGLDHSASITYVCGFGQLSSETYFFIRD